MDELSQEVEAAVEASGPARLGGVGRRGNSFAYELGHRVQPAPARPAEVIWRGPLKERHPATGLVYRLNDGYWDCYREKELRAA